MIDTGPPNQKKAILNYLKNKDIEKVVLTHHHEDHSGNSYNISHEKNIPVFSHEKGVKFLENGFSLKAYQLIFFGKSKKFVSRPFDKIIETGNGLRLEPVYTPGHSEDHVCFFEPQKKWLFTGDMFLSVKPRLFRADENLEKQILSLKKILEYDFKVIFCAHKGVIEDGYSRLKKKLEYFETISSQAYELSKKGRQPKEIAEKFFGGKGLEEYISLNHLSKINFIEQCILVGEKRSKSSV